MAKLLIEIDATLIALAYKAGLEAGFMLANETPELVEQLNVNKINTPDE